MWEKLWPACFKCYSALFVDHQLNQEIYDTDHEFFIETQDVLKSLGSTPKKVLLSLKYKGGHIKC